MITRSTPIFAPDGFASARQQRDAGTSYRSAVAAAFAGERSSELHQGKAECDHGRTYYDHNHDGYDDGLVHSHGWAVSK
jgi:hypothetical protein